MKSYGKSSANRNIDHKLFVSGKFFFAIPLARRELCSVTIFRITVLQLEKPLPCFPPPPGTFEDPVFGLQPSVEYLHKNDFAREKLMSMFMFFISCLLTVLYFAGIKFPQEVGK